MIRVLHYGLSENRGGIETYLLKITQYIDKSQFQFDFIDMNVGDAALKKELQDLGSKFYKITPRRTSPTRNKKDLEKLFEEEHFDIFHCHINTLSYILPIKIALNKGCQVIVHSRNAGIAKQIHTMLLHYIHFMQLPREKITMLAVSDEAGRWLFGKKSLYMIVNNGIDINKYCYDDKIRWEYRNTLKISNKKVIGVVGAFLPAKNHVFILEIYKELKRIDPETCLLLIGDGPLKNKIEKKCKQYNLIDVFFLGNRADVNKLYNAMDVLLMPSLFEGFPNVCLEAQTNGLPCVLSDVITKEVAVGDVTYVSLRESAHTWAVILSNSNFNSPKREIQGIKVKEKGFSVECEIKKLENIYQNLVSGSNMY